MSMYLHCDFKGTHGLQLFMYERIYCADSGCLALYFTDLYMYERIYCTDSGCLALYLTDAIWNKEHKCKCKFWSYKPFDGIYHLFISYKNLTCEAIFWCGIFDISINKHIIKILLEIMYCF